MLRSTLVWAAVLAILALGPARAEPKPPTPATLPGAKLLSAAEAKALAEGRKATFVDARKALNFGKGHIPGALSVPYEEKSDFRPDFDFSLDRVDLARLPADKGTPLVFYSDGPKGWKSYKAAVWAMRHGYRQVYWFRGGIDEWNALGYPID